MNEYISKIKNAGSEEEREAIMWEAFENRGRQFAEELATNLESVVMDVITSAGSYTVCNCEDYPCCGH